MYLTAINNEFIGSLNELLPLEPNKVSTWKQIIEFSTDEDSAKESKEFLEFCKEYKEKLPLNVNDIETNKYLIQLKHTNHLIDTIDNVLNLINEIFEMDHGVQTEIIIDDPYMPILLGNLNKGKLILKYISDYLQLVIDVNTAKNQVAKGEYKEYTIVELLDLIKAA